MKNLLNKNNQKNAGNSFANFQNVNLSKVAQKQVKGGEDIIIEEAVDA